MSEPGKKRRKEALENRMDAPDTRRERHDGHAEAATHQDVEPARLGAELAAEDRPSEETETADALKRAATKNDRP